MALRQRLSYFHNTLPEGPEAVENFDLGLNLRLLLLEHFHGSVQLHSLLLHEIVQLFEGLHILLDIESVAFGIALCGEEPGVTVVPETDERHLFTQNSGHFTYGII